MPVVQDTHSRFHVALPSRRRPSPFLHVCHVVQDGRPAALVKLPLGQGEQMRSVLRVASALVN